MNPRRPRSAAILSLGLLAPALAGCGGFTPLYAAPGVAPKLASIEVSRPDGRTGFYMGQYLDDDVAKNREEKPIYRLLLKTNEVRIPRGVRVNNVASRYEVDLNTTYTLIETATRKVVTAGVVKINVTYDSADQPYAGLAAEEDGERRAAETAADRIRLELTTFFASPRPLPANLAALSNVDISTYSERLQGSSVVSPRQRAMGQPTAQNNASSIFGGPTNSVSTPDTPGRPAFNAASDPGLQPPADTPDTSAGTPAPAPADPAAIKTLPLEPQ
jgi:LPS-assembly lipoprotein